MYKCNIYDAAGAQVNAIEIADDIHHVNARVSKGNKFYYKGVGAPYHSHYIERDSWSPDEYDLIAHTDVFYLGDRVAKKCFIGKGGIFGEKYQPQFSDLINGCGVKELSIIENSLYFKRSSVEVIKSHKVGTDQYYFVLDYKCGRRKYAQGGFPKALKKLLDYMIASDWNFVWDKNTIADITYNGLVSDVADIFRSKELHNKIGTVYSVLYSLGKLGLLEYMQLLKEYRLTHANQKSFVFNTLAILQKNGVDVAQWNHFDDEAYRDVVLNYLIIGRNCGHCSYEGLGEQIKDQYIEKTMRQWVAQNYVDKPKPNILLHEPAAKL